MKKSDIGIITKLKKKAAKSSCTYRVSAVAFDNKGNVLGQAVNKHSEWDVIEKYSGKGRSGTAKHAEHILIRQYSQNIKTILICRVGNAGALRPIDPCPACKKAAEKYGIKIISVKS